MSWGSSAPGIRRAEGRKESESRSPMLYREDATAYEPPKLCHCNPRRKAPRWISWSRQNPGRRYYACLDAMSGGCGYVEWHDDPLPQFFSELIGDLCDEVWRLKGQAIVHQFEDANAVTPMSEDQSIGREGMMLLSLQAQLKEKNAEIDALKGKYMNVMFVFIVFVLGLVVGKMVLN
ncbi:hypothetical protein VPH35_053321 [Triticum aestivum]